MVYVGARSDEDIIANGHIPHYCSVYANPNAVANCRSALALPAIFSTDCNALMQVAVGSDFRTGVDSYIECMT